MLGFLFFISIPNSPENAMAESLMKIKLNKQSFNLGDILVVSGSVAISENNRPVTITVFGPDKDLVHIEQISVSKDGTFSVPIKVDGPLWKSPGNYTVIAQGGFKNIASQAVFEFARPESKSSSVISVQDKQSGQVFNVNYTITGGKVYNISLEPQDIALALNLESNNQGSIQMQIPRALLDSKSDSNMDIPFLVFIDEGETLLATEEKSAETYRMLTIPFSEGDSEIKIIGTVVVPEFANIENIILVIAILTCTVFSILTKIKFTDKASNKLFENHRNLKLSCT